MVTRHKLAAERRAGFAALAMLGCLLAMAPVLVADKPVKTEIIGQPFVLPAGLGCAFDVGGDPDGGQKITAFSNGTTMVKGDAIIKLTNLSNGSTYVQDSNYKTIETYDAANNAVFGVGKGRIFFQFYPGDQGPYGEVAEPGAILALDGDFEFTLDLNTFFYTSFSFAGQATDICALISN